MQGVPDLLSYPVYVGEHLVVPEPQDPVARSLKSFRPDRIPALSIVVSMGLTVELDYEARSKTNEVADVLTNGMLPPEFEAGYLPIAQEPPHSFLGVVGIPSQFSRTFCVDGIASHAANIPCKRRGGNGVYITCF